MVVSAAPATVTTVAASGVAVSSATLNGNVGSLGTSASVTVGFLWGSSATLVAATNITVAVVSATGPFSTPVYVPSTNTNYYFEAWVKNATGAFVVGSILSFSIVTGGGSTTTTPPASGASGAIPLSAVGAGLSVVGAVMFFRDKKRNPLWLVMLVAGIVIVGVAMGWLAAA